MLFFLFLIDLERWWGIQLCPVILGVKFQAWPWAITRLSLTWWGKLPLPAHSVHIPARPTLRWAVQDQPVRRSRHIHTPAFLAKVSTRRGLFLGRALTWSLSQASLLRLSCLGLSRHFPPFWLTTHYFSSPSSSPLPPLTPRPIRCRSLLWGAFLAMCKTPPICADPSDPPLLPFWAETWNVVEDTSLLLSLFFALLQWVNKKFAYSLAHCLLWPT